MKEEIKKIVNTLKILGIDMIDTAKKGYPGITLSAAPILYTLYSKHLRINPKDPTWMNRDRFVLSASHGSALLYATLFMAGYPITLDDLVQYTQFGSKTPGLPNKSLTPGVDASTGASGEGFATAVGIAMAEKYIKTLISDQVHHQKLINHYIYCLVSDGDLLEGISQEAAALAGMNNLGNLIVLYDSNKATADNILSKSSKESILKRFDACGWQTDFVGDGESIDKIDKAIKRAKRVSAKPSLIEINTIIGKDSYNQGTNIVHDHPLSKDDLEHLRKKLNIKTNRFELEKSVVEKFRKDIEKRCSTEYKRWQEYYEEFKKVNTKEVQEILSFLETKNISLNFNASNFKIQSTYQEELIESNSKIMNIVSNRTKFFLGGSADLSSSTRTYLNEGRDFSPAVYNGKNIFFGLREHAMAAIAGGLAEYNLRPFVSTYLTFSDFQKSSIRSCAIRKLPVTFIYTHDGISNTHLGENYQAFEQIDSLRNIPDLNVYRPGDINEIIGTWDIIMNNPRPSCLILSNNNIHILGGTVPEKVKGGAYIVKKETNELSATIMTSGQELTTCLIIASELEKEGINLRVVSCVCQELFDIQSDEYKSSILGNKKIIAVEASPGYSWSKYTDLKNVIGIKTFGYTGNKQLVEKKLGFDKDTIKEKIKNIIKN